MAKMKNNRANIGAALFLNKIYLVSAKVLNSCHQILYNYLPLLRSIIIIFRRLINHCIDFNKGQQLLHYTEIVISLSIYMYIY